MNSKFISIVLLLNTFCAFSQSYQKEMEKHREEIHQEFLDEEHSPLTEEDRKDFHGLDFFSINEKYKIKAKFKKDLGEEFEMATSTDRKPIYQRIGYLKFKIDNEKYQLAVYQNIDLTKKEGYEDYLFIPFKDHTNGVESYGGGRYLDMRKPQKGEKWVIDFNKCYNPYCAYAERWSCPIPPEENHLEVEIPAGVKKYHE